MLCQEMPGYGGYEFKREPASECDDSSSQSAHDFFYHQSTPLLAAVKVDAAEQDVSSHVMHHLQVGVGLELCPLTPAAPAATPVRARRTQHDASASPASPRSPHAAHCFETLEPARADTGTTLLDRHLRLIADSAEPDLMPLLPVKDEPLSEGEQQVPSDETSSCGGDSPPGPRAWGPRDMQRALQALRDRRMTLTKASATYGIPSTTLWQRARRLGIDTPKREAAARSWGEAELLAALAALRAGTLSANKASKAYGIPSSTLYKIARREGIRLAAPFNAAPTRWRRGDLQRALAAIRCGAASVQRAAAQFGIPSGTLYGRCKREGIELSRANPTPWSERAMAEALEAVGVGRMSINQAAIHYNLPYSSLYGRFKRCKYRPQCVQYQQSDAQNYEVDEQMQPRRESAGWCPVTQASCSGAGEERGEVVYSQLVGEAHGVLEHWPDCAPALLHAPGYSGLATS
ncbi:PREDICTED: uncharacterized protein LOC106121072 [Papilio xuthus]|uniref:Uncharacterized protein LOC106121072 n=1 Tax=Papilio xuthus TaxID=66420 RepID=A0AAJ6ZG88_PAPXU|nr:PREDICTED: uncharacterized protein LOC106121072 [Papilio xuthus]